MRGHQIMCDTVAAAEVLERLSADGRRVIGNLVAVIVCDNGADIHLFCLDALVRSASCLGITVLHVEEHVNGRCKVIARLDRVSLFVLADSVGLKAIEARFPELIEHNEPAAEKAGAV